MTAVLGREVMCAVQVVIGVDTHQDQHVAVAIDQQGVRLAERHASATSYGYDALERWSREPGRSSRLNPNPSMDGVRTAAGWVRELQGRWLGSIGVDWRSADGLQSPHRALWPSAGAAMRGMAREYAAGNSRGPGWHEFAGKVGQLQAGSQANLTLVAGKIRLSGSTAGGAECYSVVLNVVADAAVKLGAVWLGQLWSLILLASALMPKSPYPTRAFRSDL